MTSKLSINLADLLRQSTVEGERIEYQAGWNPEGMLHTLCPFGNDFHNLGGGYIVIGVEDKERPTSVAAQVDRFRQFGCDSGGNSEPWPSRVAAQLSHAVNVLCGGGKTGIDSLGA